METITGKNDFASGIHAFSVATSVTNSEICGKVAMEATATMNTPAIWLNAGSAVLHALIVSKLPLNHE